MMLLAVPYGNWSFLDSLQSCQTSSRKYRLTYPLSFGCGNRRYGSMLTQAPTVLSDRPTPGDRSKEKRNKRCRCKPGLTCSKQAEHEEFKEHDAPDQSSECRRPRFTGTLVRIHKDWMKGKLSLGHDGLCVP